MIEENLLKTYLIIDKKPNVIICYKPSYPNLNSNVIKKVFPNCKLLVYNEKNITVSEVALLKARIMANDLEILEYDTDIPLQTNICVKINEKEIKNFCAFELLPLESSIKMPINNYEKFLKIVACCPDVTKLHNMFFEEIKVTQEMFVTGEILLTLKIDENQIFSTNYITVGNPKKHRLKKYYLENSQSLYKIPQKIVINNKNINAIGIDLGTSRCCAAVNRRNGIETVALDNTGERLLPSYVSFNEKEIKCGQIVIDQMQSHMYAKTTVFDSKRIIGRNFENVEINNIWPFEVFNDYNKPILRITQNERKIWRKAEEVAEALLKHIKQKVEEFQGKELTEAVITVPAAFTSSQMQATHEAAILAGFKNVYLLPEPVAASIAYFIERPIPNNFTMLLFDFGGGTLDVCIFKIKNNALQIISQKGDNNLGGRDFDTLLFNHISQMLINKFDINVNKNDKLTYKLMQKCIKIKHVLSVEKETL